MVHFIPPAYQIGVHCTSFSYNLFSAYGNMYDKQSGGGKNFVSVLAAFGYSIRHEMVYVFDTYTQD
jgi:hypothetical protein